MPTTFEFSLEAEFIYFGPQAGSGGARRVVSTMVGLFQRVNVCKTEGS
jgi:hypothetical protein